MEHKIILMENSLKNAIAVDQMRLKAYGVKYNLNVDSSEYPELIVKGEVLAFLYIIDEIPISACYISDFNGKLYVDYLFVLPEYQQKGYHYGRALLSYILEHKEIVERKLNKKFTESELSISKSYLSHIYESIGYKRKRESNVFSKKI